MTNIESPSNQGRIKQIVKTDTKIQKGERKIRRRTGRRK